MLRITSASKITLGITAILWVIAGFFYLAAPDHKITLASLYLMVIYSLLFLPAFIMRLETPPDNRFSEH